MNYYNEFDPFAAAWLNKLIEAGHIPQGYVDTRSITEVEPDELKKYTQCHFFAGIGGWSYALQLARWPTDSPVWTGSCPCQPFSTAGNQKGKSDERHIWPVWYSLIRKCRPSTIFGEQVASAVTHGWLDDVYQGLEAEGYACGSAVLPACSVGAPHKRDRLFFVADTQYEQAYKKQQRPTKDERGWSPDDTSRRDLDCGQSDVGNTQHPRPHGGQVEGSDGAAVQHNAERQNRSCEFEGTSETSDVSEYSWQNGVWIDCPDGKQRLVEPSIRLLANGVSNRVGKLRGYGNAIVPQVAAKFIEAYMEEC